MNSIWFTIKMIIIMELAILVQRIVSFASNNSVVPLPLMPWVINVNIGIDVKLKT